MFIKFPWFDNYLINEFGYFYKLMFHHYQIKEILWIRQKFKHVPKRTHHINISSFHLCYSSSCFYATNILESIPRGNIHGHILFGQCWIIHMFDNWCQVNLEVYSNTMEIPVGIFMTSIHPICILWIYYNSRSTTYIYL